MEKEKKFLKPEADIIELMSEDIITDSQTDFAWMVIIHLQWKSTF